jgi:phage terminase large subunit-like protein
MTVQPKYRIGPGNAPTTGPQVREFLEAVLVVPTGIDAGRHIRFRPWQREVIDDLFALRPDGRRRFRAGLIGVPRKNGKSLLGAALAIDGLLGEKEPGLQVFSAAGDRDQAKIVFAEAKKMIESSEWLSEQTVVYRDSIEVPATGSVYRALSAEAFTKEGLNPSRVIFDEVHVQISDELWDVLNLGSGTRLDPLVLGITTAGAVYNSRGAESLCYRLYEHGKRVISGEVDDPYFYMRWYEPQRDDCDYRDPVAWAECNPALGDFLYVDDFHSVVARTPEPEFRIKRLNQWVASLSNWLPFGAWDTCGTGELIPDGEDVVLAFDGSHNNDSTAITAATIGPNPHHQVVECWDRPPDADDTWKVPVLDVEDAIRDACRRWQVHHIVCDPFRWSRSLDVLRDEGLPVEEFPQSPQRMTPATGKFYEAVVNRTLTHDADPRLARHIGNALLKTDSRGPRIVKETKGSSRKIDLAICAVMAHSAATAVPEPVVEPGLLDLADYVRSSP